MASKRKSDIIAGASGLSQKKKPTASEQPGQEDIKSTSDEPTAGPSGVLQTASEEREQDDGLKCFTCNELIDAIYGVPKICDQGPAHVKFHIECLLKLQYQDNIPICPKDGNMFNYINLKCVCNCGAGALLPINLVHVAECESAALPLPIIYLGGDPENEETETIQDALNDLETQAAADIAEYDGTAAPRADNFEDLEEDDDRRSDSESP